eukprot:CAMPEP_0119070888 /NCGR_PEP_ID=MMETSP1178-20130426/44592_1 /TAXON_ID=33656 /ORGANISM="unid sp, Strain CCMP2000" /LENGTH=72 /DNA_ID=CAMNT_0007052765 /DNA_START=29 /DNA_END=243 /DNA_ORIENTATION=-
MLIHIQIDVGTDRLRVRVQLRVQLRDPVQVRRQRHSNGGAAAAPLRKWRQDRVRIEFAFSVSCLNSPIGGPP